MTRNRFNRLTLTLLLFMLTAVAAAAQKFELLDVGNAVRGERVFLTYRLSNAEANPPKPPQLAGCRFFSGPNLSTSISIVSDGRTTRQQQTIEITYVYIADKEGTVTVPPVSINIEGKKLTARGTTFKVLPPESRPSQPSAPAPSGSASPYGQQPQAPSVNVSPNDFLVRVSFSKTHVYEMEAVIASIKIYTKHNFDVPTVLEQPEFEGFLAEELEPSQRVSRESLNGQIYYAIEIKRSLLYAQNPGKHTITAGRYDVPVIVRVPVSLGFYTTYREEERRITTPRQTATLDVTALPEPKPAGFTSAVGRFKVSTDIKPNAELLRTNEASTYVYTVSGTGNIKFLTRPEIEFPGTFDAYTPKTDIDARISGADMTGTFTIEYPIVPQETGKFQIGGQPFAYFDPSDGKYHELSTPVYNVTVARGTAAPADNSSATIDTSMKDIRHIHRQPASYSAAYSSIFGQAWYWICYAVLLGGLIAVVLIYRRHARLAADVTGRRLARANRVASRRFKAAAAYIKAHDSTKFYDELATALKGYVGDKLGIAPSQLISDTIAERLEGYGATPQTAAEVIDVLNECEMARFTPSGSDSAMNELLQRATDAIRSIENVKK